MLRRTLLALSLLLLGLAVAVTAVTLMRGSRQRPATAAATPAAGTAPALIDQDAAARRLGAAVRRRTISTDTEPQPNADEFLALHADLAMQFPRVHAALEREVVGGYSLLYRWPGSDASARPVVLMAHQDVVPIAPGTDKDWEVDPFSGAIRDGFVWGRGAWDDKGNLMAQLEAIELLLAEGFRPRQTIWLAYGHDEESTGVRGAAKIAQRLQELGVRPAWVLDEGLLIAERSMPGLDAPVALIGIAEKGYLTLTLTASAQGGHSSMPPRASAIGTLAAALSRIEARPLPARLSGVAREMFETVAPEMRGLNRVLLSNLWLFGPLVSHEMQKSPNTNAMLRTTTALTTLGAGNRANVLPPQAQAQVNFRLLPGDTVAQVIEHVRAAIDDPSIRIEALPDATEASRTTSIDSAGFRLVERTMRALHPDVVVSPGLMVGMTDSRFLDPFSDAVLRFSPVRATPDDLKRFHGTNERMSIPNYVEIIRFYHRLLREASLPEAGGG